MRRAALIDSNQPEIVEALRRIGCFVVLTHQLKCLFDILVFYRGKTFVMEIKNTDYLPKVYDRERLEKTLTDGERKTMNAIQDTGNTYHIVATVEEAIEIVTS